MDIGSGIDRAAERASSFAPLFDLPEDDLGLGQPIDQQGSAGAHDRVHEFGIFLNHIREKGKIPLQNGFAAKFDPFCDTFLT